MSWIGRKTGVHPNTKCLKCRITAAKSFALGPVATGINHPVYFETYSFYKYGEDKHMCPRCHREKELANCLKAMDNYSEKHGEKALARKCGIGAIK